MVLGLRPIERIGVALGKTLSDKINENYSRHTDV